MIQHNKFRKSQQNSLLLYVQMNQILMARSVKLRNKIVLSANRPEFASFWNVE